MRRGLHGASRMHDRGDYKNYHPTVTLYDASSLFFVNKELAEKYMWVRHLSARLGQFRVLRLKTIHSQFLPQNQYHRHSGHVSVQRECSRRAGTVRFGSSLVFGWSSHFAATFEYRTEFVSSSWYRCSVASSPVWPEYNSFLVSRQFTIISSIVSIYCYYQVLLHFIPLIKTVNGNRSQIRFARVI